MCLSIHPWSYAISLWTRCLTNCLWEFHHIYNLGAMGDKGELIRFEVKRWMVKATTRPNIVKNHLLKNASFQQRHTGRHFPTAFRGHSTCGHSLPRIFSWPDVSPRWLHPGLLSFTACKLLVKMMILKCFHSTLISKFLLTIIYKYWLVPEITLKNYAPKLCNVTEGQRPEGNIAHCGA